VLTWSSPINAMTISRAKKRAEPAFHILTTISLQNISAIRKAKHSFAELNVKMAPSKCCNMRCSKWLDDYWFCILSSCIIVLILCFHYRSVLPMQKNCTFCRIQLVPHLRRKYDPEFNAHFANPINAIIYGHLHTEIRTLARDLEFLAEEEWMFGLVE
jgi:hypothetical protein